MPHSSNNKKPVATRGNSLNTQTPISSPPVYSPPQKSTLWDSVKMGFGMSMGTRMFGFIFGDPTVKVEHKNQPPPTSVYETPVKTSETSSNVIQTSKDKCFDLREEIKLYQCDKELNTKHCDDLFREFYKCQKNF